MMCGDKRGTNAGYQRHLAHRESACDFCRAAHRERERERSGHQPHKPAEHKTCSVEDCYSIVIALGFCDKHYRKNRKYGDPLVSVYSPAPAGGVCTVPGCGRGGKLTKGFCTKHYQKWRKYGDPVGGKEYMPSPADGFCTEEDCFEPHFSSGSCRKHYMRWWTNDDMDLRPMGARGWRNFYYKGDDAT